MNSFENFSRRIQNINSAVISANERKSYDDGCWKITPDKEKGVGSAVIRFLPPKNTDLPYVKILNHFFRGETSQWCIIERCPRSFNEECPICKSNMELWKQGTEGQNKARLRKAKVQYAFNILVIKDNQNPENNGKVFIYKCGPAIFQMIMDAMKEQFGEEAKHPFDVYNGNNFLLRVRNDPTKNNLPQYDKSKFDDNQTDLASSQEELRRIYDSMADLNEFLQRGRLSYKDVEKKFKNTCINTTEEYPSEPENGYSSMEEVFGNTNTTSNTTSNPAQKKQESAFERMDDLPWDDDGNAKKNDNPVGGSESMNEDDDPALAFFKNL